MSKVYFTSDLHFGHKNLCEGLRGMSADESDALILENWNKTVNKNDKVFILGDLTMEEPKCLDILNRLKGQKVLIGGNHDTPEVVKHLSLFYKIPVLGAIQYKEFICTHIPIHPCELHRFKGNIHGHLHIAGEITSFGTYTSGKLEGNYFNVNTEFHGYKPISFDEIEQSFKI